MTDMRIASKVWVWVCGCADIGGYCGLVDAVATVLVRAIYRRVSVLGRVYKTRIRELGANGTCIIYHHSRESQPTIDTTDQTFHPRPRHGRSRVPSLRNAHAPLLILRHGPPRRTVRPRHRHQHNLPARLRTLDRELNPCSQLPGRDP